MPSPVLKRVPRILASSQPGPEIARAHLGVGLEAARGQHHAFGLHLVGLAALLDLDAVHAVVVGQKLEGARAVGDGDVVLARDLGERVDQARPAADRFHRQAAPELEHAADLVGLAAPDRHEAHALVAHPQHGGLAVLDQHLAQIGIGAVFGDAAHVVEELLLGVGAEVGLRHLLIRQVGHQLAQVLDAVIDAAEGAGGKAAVAAGLVLRRALEHQHRDALLGRSQGRAKRRIAAANDDDIRG